MVKWPDIRLLGTFCTFAFHKSKKSIEFLLVKIYGDFGKIRALRCSSLVVYSAFECDRGFENGQIYDFGLILYISMPPKVNNKKISGSTNFRRLLENGLMYDFWAHFVLPCPKNKK